MKVKINMVQILSSKIANFLKEDYVKTTQGKISKSDFITIQKQANMIILVNLLLQSTMCWIQKEFLFWMTEAEIKVALDF